jgi:hypothetical protein
MNTTKDEVTYPSEIVKEAAINAKIPEDKIIKLIKFGVDDTFFEYCKDNPGDYSNDEFFSMVKGILTREESDAFLSKIEETAAAAKATEEEAGQGKSSNKGGGKRKRRGRKSKKRKSKKRKSRKRSKTRRRR